MRKPTVYVALATVVIVGLVACSQPDGSSNNPPLSPTTHVYIAGKVGNSTNNILPVYWKDGVINYLQLSPTYTNGWAVGITVDKAGNVYVQGGQWIINTSTVVYGYWKGSSFTPLTVPPAYTTLWEEGIAVDTSGNVWLAYTVGSSSPPIIPAYWENSGSPLSLPNATNVCNVGAD